MRRAEYKRTPYRSKSYYAQDRLNHRGIYKSITPQWTRWAKRYLSRYTRRKWRENNS